MPKQIPAQSVFNNRIEQKYHPVATSLAAKRQHMVLKSADRDPKLWPFANDVWLPFLDEDGNPCTITGAYRIDLKRLVVLNASQTISSINCEICISTPSDPSGQPPLLLNIPQGNYSLITDLLDLIVSTVNAITASASIAPKYFTYTYNFLNVECSFAMYALSSNLPMNPISIADATSTTMSISVPSHGLSVNDVFLLVGVSDVVGGNLPASLFNGQLFNVISIPDANTVVATLPSTTFNGGSFGGNQVQLGKLAPFRFIATPNTILPTIGFNNISSSEVCASTSFSQMGSPNGGSSNNNTVLGTLVYAKHQLSVGDRIILTMNKSLDAIPVYVYSVIDVNTFTVQLPSAPSDSPIFISSRLIGARSVQRSHYYSDQNLMEQVYINLGGDDVMYFITPELSLIDRYQVAGLRNVLASVYLSGELASKTYTGLAPLRRLFADTNMNGLRLSLLFAPDRPVHLHGLDYTLEFDITSR